MAPERFRRGPYGPPSDVYSVGTVLYEMLSGRLPFVPTSPDPLALLAMQTEDEPPPIGPLCPEISPALEALVRSALNKDPSERPSAERLAARLAEVSTELYTPLDGDVD
jgi:serine/threonine-protein kinase